MRLNKLQPLWTLERFYVEELEHYKTAATKKSRMTRDIKEHEEWIADVQKAVNGDNWLHGERFFEFHLTHYKCELELLQKIRNNIK